MTRCTALWLLGFLTVISGCSSSTPGGRWLYDESTPPKLLDAEIRMNTLRRAKGDKKPDIRIIKVVDGEISCSLSSRVRNVEGEGTLSAKEYGQIWSLIEELGGFNQEAEAPDQTGGYYHAISFRLGHRLGQSSAQNRSNFLGLGTTEIQARLSLANAITRAVEANVTIREMAPPPESDSTKK